MAPANVPVAASFSLSPQGLREKEAAYVLNQKHMV